MGFDLFRILAYIKYVLPERSFDKKYIGLLDCITSEDIFKIKRSLFH